MFKIVLAAIALLTFCTTANAGARAHVIYVSEDRPAEVYIDPVPVEREARTPEEFRDNCIGTTSLSYSDEKGISMKCDSWLDGEVEVPAGHEPTAVERRITPEDLLDKCLGTLSFVHTKERGLSLVCDSWMD